LKFTVFGWFLPSKCLSNTPSAGCAAGCGLGAEGAVFFFCVFRLESQINRSIRSGLTIQDDALPNKDGGLIGNMWYNQIQQAC
jgi:hypothetical protein